MAGCFRIRPESPTEREQRWRLVAHIMETWSMLYQSEQGFLFEVGITMACPIQK